MSLLPRLRRIALNQQGLLKNNFFGRGRQATLRAIEHLGYVQIDTISVVQRAHHHVLWSRVDNYAPKHIDQLVSQRKIFEYWFHAASWLPMRDYRFALPRMAQLDGDRNWFKSFDRQLSSHILERIKHEGPLMARDFEDSREGKKEWWDWKPAKQALEQLFMQGELMVSERRGFQKVYELTERILPDWVDTRIPTTPEFADYLIDTNLRAHGFASQQSMTYLRKGKALRNALSEQLQARIDDKRLTKLKLANGGVYFIDPELLETRAPRCAARAQILSPFDNTVIQRQRGREIFAFDYQIECYVPEEKRQFGYFCLPLLYRDKFVGRIDCKAHRRQALLEVKSLHLEVKTDREFDKAFEDELSSFAKFNACSQIAKPDQPPLRL